MRARSGGFGLHRPVTRTGAFELLSSRELLETAVESLEDRLSMPRRLTLQEHFHNRFLDQPEEQLGEVRETIGSYCPANVPTTPTSDSAGDLSAADL